KRDTGFALRALLVVVLLGIAWRVFSLGMADAESRTSSDQALQWRARHASALFLLAEQQAKEPASHDEARKNALSALLAYPLEGRAYRILGQLAEVEKNTEQAFELYQKAVRYSPRDIESHLWLMNYSLRTENANAAVFHLDRMLRMRVDLLPQLASTIGGLAIHPSSQDVLIRYLAKHPAWRIHAIKAIAAHKDAGQLYAVFFSRLEKSEGGLNEDEQQAWLNALNQNQQWSLAYLNWASQLSPTRQLELGNLFNGSFEHEPLGGEFDWQFQQVPGAVIDRLFREGASGELALRVSFEGRRVLFSHVKQTLVLPAGHYRLSGKALADDLRSEIGLVWSVQCLDKGGRLAITEPMKGHSQGWQAFSTEFDVPKNECLAQSLSLMLPARVPSEEEIGGSIWFDALRIQRIQGFTEQQANKPAL
ncbi:MAG: tetratricopeptide repeat protein, partial [Arenimonas sp.]